MPKLGPVEYAIPFFILAIIAEMLWARRKRPDAYEPRDTLTSLALGTGSTAVGGLTAALVVAAMVWLYDHRIATIGSGERRFTPVTLDLGEQAQIWAASLRRLKR